MYRDAATAAALPAETAVTHAHKPAAKLSDFGGAFFYEPGSGDGRELERMEARAFGIMLGEVCEQHDGVAAGDAGLTVEHVRGLAAVGPARYCSPCHW